MKRARSRLAPDLTPYERYPANYPHNFVAFDDLHPDVYANMLAHARKLQAEKRTRVSVKFLLEYERLYGRQRDGDPIYIAIDNNFATFFGRRLAAENPELRGLFRLRRRRGEKDARDTGQTALEYD